MISDTSVEEILQGERCRRQLIIEETKAGPIAEFESGYAEEALENSKE